MTANAFTAGLQFLSVAEAAEKLGVSRIRVREAAARGDFPSIRDNEGRLRLDLTGALRVAGGAVDPGAMLDLLFDEVEDLQAELTASQRAVTDLGALAGRQSEALDRAEAQLDAAAAQNAQMTGLLDRAMAHLETGAEDWRRDWRRSRCAAGPGA